ncbi:MAG: O-antigen ligase family protein [Pyrinomonadaceae bacterium]|nr:O-antigen ligase family protein [Pyrinomonadaceae bacterium]
MTEATKDEAIVSENGGPLGSRTSSLIFILLLLIPIISTILFGAVDPPAIGLLAASSAFVFILWLSTVWGTSTFLFSRDPLQFPLLGLILIAVIQLLPLGGETVSAELAQLAPASSLSIDPFSTRMFLVRVAAVFIFFAAALTFISNGPRIRKTVITIVIFGALMAFFGILQRLAAPEAIYGLRPTPQAIPFGSFVNQHHFAAFMEMTCGMTLGLVLGKGVKRDKKLLLWMAVIVMALAVFFTGSRGGVLSLAATVVTAAAASLIFRSAGLDHGELDAGDILSGKVKALIGAAAVGLILVGLVGFLGAGEGLLRGVDPNATADATSGRLHFWAVALKIFLANPVFGVGFDAFGAAFTRFDTWNGTFRLEQAHNDYLQMLADGGILGFACIAAFVVLFFKRVLGSIAKVEDRFERSAAIGALAGCVGILVHNLVDFPLRTTSNSYFFMLLVVIATYGGSAVHRSRHRSHDANGPERSHPFSRTGRRS